MLFVVVCGMCRLSVLVFVRGCLCMLGVVVCVMCCMCLLWFVRGCHCVPMCDRVCAWLHVGVRVCSWLSLIMCVLLFVVVL